VGDRRARERVRVRAVVVVVGVAVWDPEGGREGADIRSRW